MSLNAGLVSNLNYGNISPRAISVITFAHEIGHNMGSPVSVHLSQLTQRYDHYCNRVSTTACLQHDEEGTDCAPGGTQGNYIMYPHATAADKPNNMMFSACSIASMHTIMERDARDESDEACFQREHLHPPLTSFWPWFWLEVMFRHCFSHRRFDLWESDQGSE